MEALASGEELTLAGMETVFARHPTGDRSRWSEREWAVIDDFQRAYLRNVQRDEAFALDDTLCMFARGGWPLDDLFAQVDAWPTDRLVEQLSRDWSTAWGYEIWITPFWDDEDVPWRFWTRPALYERFLDCGADSRTAPDIARRAYDLATVIDDRRPWEASR